MLENLRYNRALMSAKCANGENNLGTYLDTEFAYQSLVRKTTFESGLLVINPQIITEAPLLIIELIGMPNSGKSSALRKLADHIPSDLIIVTDIANDHKTRIGALTEPIDPTLFHIENKVHLEQFMDSLKHSFLKRYTPPPVLVIERGLWDKQVFDHHNYRLGYLHPHLFTPDDKYRFPQVLKVLPSCIINCLIPPQISLAREADPTAPKFVDRNVLYDEYLLFHHLATQGSLPIPLYTALDLNTDPESAIQTIVRTITQFKNNFFHYKQLQPQSQKSLNQ